MGNLDDILKKARAVQSQGLGSEPEATPPPAQPEPAPAAPANPEPAAPTNPEEVLADMPELVMQTPGEEPAAPQPPAQGQAPSPPPTTPPPPEPAAPAAPEPQVQESPPGFHTNGPVASSPTASPWETPSEPAAPTASPSNEAAPPPVRPDPTPNPTPAPAGGFDRSPADAPAPPLRRPGDGSTTERLDLNRFMNPQRSSAGGTPMSQTPSLGGSGQGFTQPSQPSQQVSTQQPTPSAQPQQQQQQQASPPPQPQTLNANANAQSQAGGSSSPFLGTMLGKGLDIGTANLVAATQGGDGIQLNLQRNAFIDVHSDVYTKNMLTKLGVPYAVQGERLYVLGDSSFELANIFGRETRRPMAKGLISPSEVDALPVIRLLIERVLGAPRQQGEPIYFSVPAEPIDSDLNVVYHEGIFKGLLSKLGYNAQPIVEGHAVCLSELADDNFTGIGISCGGGMFNVCVSYKTIPALAFSTSRAGDWVDQNVAAVIGIPISKATLIKEEGIDLMDPQGREQEAVAIYYRNLINYTLTNIKHRFESSEGMPIFREPISIVCSGGTSMVGNFIACFQDEFQKVNFPIPVKEIRHAENPLMVVAKGALIAAALGDNAAV